MFGKKAVYAYRYRLAVLSQDLVPKIKPSSLFDVRAEV
jgi:hypothetical protein